MKPGRLLLVLLLLSLSTLLHAADIQITLQKSFFTPNHITVKKGEPVRLTLKSVDVTHGFAIDELDIAREIAPGPPVVLEFTPAHAGKFDYYCVVRCGKDHLKMRGVLTVTD